jgi:hypothetical protein
MVTLIPLIITASWTLFSQHYPRGFHQTVIQLEFKVCNEGKNLLVGSNCGRITWSAGTNTNGTKVSNSSLPNYLWKKKQDTRLPSHLLPASPNRLLQQSRYTCKANVADGWC